MSQAARVGMSAPQQLRCEYRENPLGIGEPRPRLSWWVNDPRRGARQSAWRVLVASTAESLARDTGDLWDSGKVSSDRTSQVEYAGRPLESGGRCWWKVRVWDAGGEASPSSEPAWWEMGLLRPEDWKGAWIFDEGCRFRGPIPYLRKTFALAKPVARARVYATARGVYELHINGRRVGEDLFTPGWTDYTRRIQYHAYDVTEMLARGENVLGAILGAGWYCGSLGWQGPRQYGDRPEFLMQLVVEYAGGGSETIVTDGSWKTAAGPIVESDFQMGETCDARLEMPGWDKPGFDDSRWSGVCVAQPPPAVRLCDAAALPPAEAAGPQLVAAPAEPVRRLEELKCFGITEPRPGVYVVDLGQNMVGRVRLRVKGRRGTEITLRHAEILNPDGSIYTANLRKAKCTDKYVLRGEGVETWEPVFTWRGFRYVEVAGYPGQPVLDDFTGVVIGSGVPSAGTFECSSAMVNQLQHNIVWSQRGNYLEVPTDCPQRDERLGWMGDAQIFLRTATFNADVSAFMTKWLIDVEDAQTPEGRFPNVAPDPFKPPIEPGDADPKVGRCGAPGWADAGVICPWITWLVYGDTRILERRYDAMCRWIEFERRTSADLVRPWFGWADWLNVKAFTPSDLLGTAYFAYSTRLVAKIANVLGRRADAKRFEELFEQVRAAFNREFVTPGGRLAGDTQTAYVIALTFDLLPGEKREAAVRRLVDDIAWRDNHLSTGFLGAGLLLPCLTAIGRTDLAYVLLLNETFPSWGYSIRHGATTMWEHWDGWTEEKGFQDPGMNSFNHYAYGAVGEWLFRAVAGIDLDEQEPAYRHVVIHPRPGGGLTYARATYDSIRGRIATDWRITEDKFRLHVVIPPGARATVHVPAASVDAVTEGGRALPRSEGISNVRFDKGEVVCDAEAGSYDFTSVMPRG